VVDVGDAEVQRSEEDDLLLGEVREQVQRNHERAPYDLLADRALG
jgi:hypothetical protein